MKRLLLRSAVFMYLLVMVTTAGAAVFSVTPTSDSDCSDFSCDLQSALNAAAANGQNDTINLAAGTYHFPATITYKPSAASGENFSLTLTGAGESTTILDGGTKAQLLNFDATLLADGAQASISLNDLTVSGSGEIRLATKASLYLSGKLIACVVSLAGNSVNVSLGSTIDTAGATFGAGTCAGLVNVAGSGVGNAGGSLTVIAGTTPVSDVVLSTGLTGSSGGSITLCTSGSCGTGFERPPGGTIGLNVNLNPPGFFSLRTIDTQIATVAGSTITLDNAQLLAAGDVNKGWRQISGPTVTLSDAMTLSPTFVVPPVANAGATFQFERTIVNNAGVTIVSPFTVSASDNGITNFPSAAVTFKSSTNENMGMSVNNGAVTSLTAIDPTALANTANKPSNLLYGMLDMQIKVNSPGDTATVTIMLPAPAPAGATWFKYDTQQGWYDFGEHVVFNADRTQVTLTLTDGGIGDDDGVANTVIIDPSGLASGSSSEQGRSGCFIATAAYGSILHPCVTTLRNFRDTFLLTNPLGKGFVKLYYKHSPPVADFIARHTTLKYLIRICLLPLIALSWLALNFGLKALLLIPVLPIFLMCARSIYKGYSTRCEFFYH